CCISFSSLRPGQESSDTPSQLFERTERKYLRTSKSCGELFKILLWILSSARLFFCWTPLMSAKVQNNRISSRSSRNLNRDKFALRLQRTSNSLSQVARIGISKRDLIVSLVTSLAF